MTKGLEALNVLKEEKLYLSNYNTNEILNTIEKELKLLDILKECYNCGMIQLRATIDGKYYIDYSTHFMEISKEQYETLYEVLKNEHKTTFGNEPK